MSKERSIPDQLHEQLLKERKPFRLDDISEAVGVGVEAVREVIDKLRDEGYTFETAGDYVMRAKSPKPQHGVDLSKRWSRDLHFGVVSDTHFDSKQERPDALQAMYDIFLAEGVQVVFHAGDLMEGVGVYRGQELEVKAFGQGEQIENAIKRYPKRKGIQTLFITGNHDLRAYERGGVDPGVPIARARRDMHYLGPMVAEVKLPGKIRAEMLHPDGNTAYALSYRAQRDINNRQSSQIPDVLIFGHYHTSYYMRYRGIDFLQVPCFKDAGLWEKRKGLNPTIGGWIVDARLSSDLERVDRFKPELFTFDKRGK